MKRIFLLVTVVCLSLTGFRKAGTDTAFIAENFKYADRQLANMLKETGTNNNSFPRSIDKSGKLVTTNMYDWTPGFFPGNLWYTYEYTGDTALKTAATRWTEKLEPVQYYTQNHDLGFMMYCSYGNAYRLTGNSTYRDILLQSARSLCKRYNPVTGSIKSWNAFRSWHGNQTYSFPVIIDNMMNLELLFFAAKATGDTSFRHIAVTHALNTMKNHIRKDYSSYHVVCYDSAAGKVTTQETAQGYADNSTWARGQAWGIYGFTMTYRETRDPRFLKTARGMADWFINHDNLPADKVPYWDFNANQPGYTPGVNSKAKMIATQPRDASAAAITASALFELSAYCGKEGAKYRKAAVQMLHTLASPAYRAPEGANGNFLLMHSVGSAAHGSEVDVPLVYADYYFLEALTRYHQLLNGKGVAQKANRNAREAAPVAVATGAQDREYWCKLLYKMSSPVIFNLAQGTLKKNMPVEKAPGYTLNAEKVTYLEAVGRTMAGVAPWLALPDDTTKESAQRKELREALWKGIANAVNPNHPDYLNFRTEHQNIVDAAFMAHAFLRAPKALWQPLDSLTKKRVAEEFKALRTRSGAYNNWLLFAGINEAFLLSIGEQPDPVRIEFARRKILEWYEGDGWYSDGPSMSIDYYNSYVVHPMLVDLFKVLADKKRIRTEEYETAVKRMVRYSEFLERFIAPDGSYPTFGRSITYRTASFQALAQTALMEKLPGHIVPAQVRCALTAIMHRMYDGCNNFDSNGWLVLGFCGHQPAVADTYTSTGSLYMATLGFLPLGLPADHSFWTAPAAAWTSKKAWSSEPFKKDYHVDY